MVDEIHEAWRRGQMPDEAKNYTNSFRKEWVEPDNAHFRSNSHTIREKHLPSQQITMETPLKDNVMTKEDPIDNGTILGLNIEINGLALQ